MEKIEHKFIKANSSKHHVADIGSSSGPPVTILFLHGFSELWYTWRFQMVAAVNAGYRAIAPDYRGYGLSDPPSESEKATLMTLFLLWLLFDALHISKVFFFVLVIFIICFSVLFYLVMDVRKLNFWFSRCLFRAFFIRSLIDVWISWEYSISLICWSIHELLSSLCSWRMLKHVSSFCIRKERLPLASSRDRSFLRITGNT